MSSDQPKILYNTRERALSSDQNIGVQMSDRALQEALRHLAGEDVGRSGVIRGLLVTIGSGMVANVSTGLAILEDAAKVFPDSQHRWIELLSQGSVTIADGDPTNPRWDVIEIEPGVSTSLSTTRDIYQNSLGTFTTVTVDKQQTSAPSITVRQGTPAASPAFPAGAAGKIPLAYVLVPAGENDLGTNAPNNVVRCRPVLRQVGPEVTQGGGITASGGSASGTVGKTRHREADTPLTMEARGSVNFGTSQTVESNATYPPAANAAMYVYMVPPAFPAGHDASLAPRELDVLGSGLAPSLNVLHKNCIVVLSDFGPNPNQPIKGEGTMPSFTLPDAVWGGVSFDSTKTVYIGSCRVDTGGNLLDQHARGSTVVLRASHPTESDVRNNATSGTVSGNLRDEQPLNGGGQNVLPDTAERFKCVSSLIMASGAAASLTLTETSQGSDTTILAYGLSGSQAINEHLWIEATSGGFEWLHAETGSDNSTFSVTVLAYEDVILARR